MFLVDDDSHFLKATRDQFSNNENDQFSNAFSIDSLFTTNMNE
jgi:hypothetical protein